MKPWKYAQNIFLSVTNTSYSNAMAISNRHNSALEAEIKDPYILERYNLFHPKHEAYKAAYNAWLTQGGTQQGETLNINQLLQLLSSTKIQDWDLLIQVQYRSKTPQYKKLLPNRREPFQSGSQDDRIQAVLSLKESIGTDPKLAAVKTDVDSFYGMIDAAFTAQKGSLSTTKKMSSSLEAARVEMCIAQYANLGSLMDKFAATPEKIENYFDLQTLRNGSQVVFTGQLKAGEVYTVVKHTFGENDQVVIGNNGNTTLKFYLASEKGMQPNGDGITLIKGKETILANTLGKLTDTYLTVVNTNALMAGEFSVEIV